MYTTLFCVVLFWFWFRVTLSCAQILLRDHSCQTLRNHMRSLGFKPRSLQALANARPAVLLHWLLYQILKITRTTEGEEKSEWQRLGKGADVKKADQGPLETEIFFIFTVATDACTYTCDKTTQRMYPYVCLDTYVSKQMHIWVYGCL